MAARDGVVANGGSVVITAPLRFHHLSGGVAFLLGQNKLGWIIGPKVDPLRLVTARDLNAPQKVFQGYAPLRVLGRTTYQHADEMRDPVTDNFVLSAATAQHKCLANSQLQHWRGIAVALEMDGRGPDSNLASRIGSQIRICTRRLEQLSNAYRTVLSLVGEPARSDQRSVKCDKYAQHIGTEFRSLLNELYGLRDAINAAAYRLKYALDKGFNSDRFRRAVEADAGGFGRLALQSMYDPSADRLIEHMSLQRNVMLHSLGRNHPIFGDGYQQLLATGPLGDIPYLIWPLYDDMDRLREIDRSSSRGVLCDITREEAERFLASPDRTDALEFAFDCLVRLLRMAELLAAETALPSRLRTITDDDIVEATFTDETGKVQRVRRDGTTGKLVGY